MTTYSIAGFIEHLAVMAEEVLLAEHRALKAAAILVEAEAKSEFGVYQGQIGPFDKWDELADATKIDRVTQGYSENDPLLRSGELRDSIGHALDGLNAVVGSTSDVMVYQELGDEKLPPRPVLGPALLRKEREVVTLLGHYTATAMLKGSEFSHLPRLEHGGD